MVTLMLNEYLTGHSSDTIAFIFIISLALAGRVRSTYMVGKKAKEFCSVRTKCTYIVPKVGSSLKPTKT